MATTWKVDTGDGQTTALYEPVPESDSDVVFVCAHGAGGHMHDGGMKRVAAQLLTRGISIVRFNFMYSEEGSRRPDRMPRLKECFEAVVARTRAETHARRLLIGGRSMGGRAASMLAADGFSCDGLLLLAYPLHPAGKHEQLRDAHLSSIRVPAICFNGTRDSLCRRDLMEAVVEGLTTRWTMHWLEGADHSFHVLKSSGRTDADVLSEIGTATAGWVDRLPAVGG